MHTFLASEWITSIAEGAGDFNMFKWIGHALAKVYPLFCWSTWRESELVLVDAKGASGKRGVG